MRRIDYLKAFLKSGEHAALALFTLGVPFALAKPLALVVGASLYVLGWVFLPDRAGFKARVDAKARAVDDEREAAALALAETQRQEQFHRLGPDARRRYGELARVCADIEGQLSSSSLADSYPTEKLDGLMWSYLGLLVTEGNLGEHIEKESRENFAAREQACALEIAGLKEELARLAPNAPEYEGRFRLLGAKEEGCAALQRRHEQFRRAQQNLELVRAEQTRIEEQLKLLRADLFASQSAGQFTQRINDTIDSLSSGSRIAGDVAPAMPELPSLRSKRVGYTIAER